ncbi:MAG: iron-containing alcohol dehydrogenase [Candidatus Sericytochromatia bacterium]
MQNFSFHNPVKILFGEGQIAKIAREIPAEARILVTYGGGSIKANGVYDQVMQALSGRDVREFGGIEANPRYETLMRAVDLAREEKVDFLLAVGGGSVLDGTKFIAAAVPFTGELWAILADRAPVNEAVPLGAVLTLPATGSEMNAFSVVSREATQEKLGFFSPLVYPRFSVLDPTTTYSLPPRQIGNGVVDAFVHTVEQYLTYPAGAPLQDRFAEGVLLTLIEEGPKTLAEPRNYEARANVMWCATMALNGMIGVGVPQDWATHGIGHELTALFGLDHAQTLAVVLPSLLTVQKAGKLDKLVQYAERVWDIRQGTPEQKAELAIVSTRAFFEAMGVKTRLSEYGVAADQLGAIPERLAARGPIALGEHGDIDGEKVKAILAGAL